MGLFRVVYVNLKSSVARIVNCSDPDGNPRPINFADLIAYHPESTNGRENENEALDMMQIPIGGESPASDAEEDAPGQESDHEMEDDIPIRLPSEAPPEDVDEVKSNAPSESPSSLVDGTNSSQQLGSDNMSVSSAASSLPATSSKPPTGPSIALKLDKYRATRRKGRKATSSWQEVRKECTPVTDTEAYPGRIVWAIYNKKPWPAAILSPTSVESKNLATSPKFADSRMRHVLFFDAKRDFSGVWKKDIYDFVKYRKQFTVKDKSVAEAIKRADAAFKQARKKQEIDFNLDQSDTSTHTSEVASKQ